jgi:hypothetical protein
MCVFVEAIASCVCNDNNSNVIMSKTCRDNCKAMCVRMCICNVAKILSSHKKVALFVIYSSICAADAGCATRQLASLPIIISMHHGRVLNSRGDTL